MASTKFPEKFRITLRPYGEHPLGFANVYDPHTAAYAKRAITQNNWAYGTWKERNGLFFTEERKYVAKKLPDSGYDCVLTEVQIENQYQPIIINNVPSSGFKIVTSVSRASTSNKLWRILDPRGFLLEISCDNLEEIIAKGAIENGEIIGNCQWRTGKILERV